MLHFKLFLPPFLHPMTLYCFDYCRALLKLLTVIFSFKKEPHRENSLKIAEDIQRARIKGDKDPPSGFEL